MAITTFFFDRAKYKIGDEYGNEIFVEINYKENSFEIRKIRSIDQYFEKLKKDVSVIAKDLLVRKYNVNFYKKFE